MNAAEIQKLKFATLEAESRVAKARKDLVEAEVDLKVAIALVRQAEAAQDQTDNPPTQ